MNHRFLKFAQIFAIIVLTTIFSLQGVMAKEVTVPVLTNLTDVIVRSHDGVFKHITNPDQLGKIMRFINTQREGWDKPWYGVPAGPLLLELYDGKNYQGEISVGDTFLETQRNGGFWSKGITKKRREEILGLVGELPASLKEVQLLEISGVTKILVRTGLGGSITKTITDSEQIKAIVAFVNQQRKGWDRRWLGDAAQIIVIELQDKKGFLGEFGIGSDFFEAGEDDTGFHLLSKDVTKEQRAEILKLIDQPNKNP